MEWLTIIMGFLQLCMKPDPTPADYAAKSKNYAKKAWNEKKGRFRKGAVRRVAQAIQDDDPSVDDSEAEDMAEQHLMRAKDEDVSVLEAEFAAARAAAGN